MDHLFLLQFACFLFMLFNAFTLAVTRLQTRWLNPRYERARWLIFVGIMGLAAHYLMQMCFGFRAVDDAVGATVNALVYAPCFSLISMGIFHIEATHVRRGRVYAVCAAINLAIFACFFIGCLHYGSMRIGAWLYAMQALFAANVVYCIVVIVREIIRRRRLLETMAGGDIMPYVRYSRASLLISLSHAIHVSKDELTIYFDQSLKTTFRIWLSDIRFAAAKKMMIANPDYSNDIISSECGFTSRTHLYRIFKAREACTPTVWRERYLAGSHDSDASLS